MASATLLNTTSLSGEGLSANGLTGAAISGGSHHAALSSLSSGLSGGLSGGLPNGLSCNGLSSDNCASNNLSVNHSNSSSANLLESSRLDHRPTRSKITTLPDINNNANGSSITGGANAMTQNDLGSANTSNASALNSTASSSNSNSASNLNGLNSSNNLNSSNSLNSSNQAGNLNSADPNQTNNQLTNSSYSDRSTEMLKRKQSAASSIENSPPDYRLNKKTCDSSNMNKSTASFSSNLYSEVAMDVKVISQDCVIYSYCSDVNIAIEDHFKRALNTNIYSNSNDKHKGKTR